MIQRGTRPHVVVLTGTGGARPYAAAFVTIMRGPFRLTSLYYWKGGRAYGGLRGLHRFRDCEIGSGPMGRRWQGRRVPSPEKQVRVRIRKAPQDRESDLGQPQMGSKD